MGARALPMISRTGFFITAAFGCHLLLAPRVVTAEAQLICPPPRPSVSKGQEADICAAKQEKNGPLWKWHVRGRIAYRSFLLWADEATYHENTGDVTLEGHVLLEGGPNDENIQASHATYNVQTETGRFYDVIGTIGARQHERRLLLTTSNPFAFSGKVVDKTGPDHYVVHDGIVTSCELPHPKWQFNTHHTVVEVGHNAYIYRSTFRLRGIPVFYFPFATHPVTRMARQSGFLTPSFGSSSIKGLLFGDSYFWAINRSMDATIGAQYFSRRGSAEHGEFRWRPSDSSYLYLTYFGVLDRGVGRPRVNQGGEDVRLIAEGRFGHNFRAVANVDYLSSFIFRLVFNEVFTQAVYSEVRSLGFLSNTRGGFSFNAEIDRYQSFESANNGDVITILHAPSFEFSSVDRHLGRSPFYWTFDTAAEGLSRSEPPANGPTGTALAFRTAPIVGRFDFNPRLSLPLSFHGWSLRPEVGIRDTLYSQQLIPSSGIRVASNDPLNRRALEASLELRPPTLERVFDPGLLGRKLKHAVEPRLLYRRVTGVNNFPNILRFDERDILSDTNELEYGVISRLYTKRIAADAENCQPASNTPTTSQTGSAPQLATIPKRNCVPEPPARELISWEVAQKYFLDPNFGGALVTGRQNVFTTTADFSAIAFLTGAQHLSPLISRLHILPTAHIDGQWYLDYDFKAGKINSSTALLNYHIGQFGFGGGDAYLQAPGEVLVSSKLPKAARFHQFRMSMTYGTSSKRGFSAAAAVGFDENLGFLQYSAVQSTYNWDCCGVSIEYRRFALGTVRNENQYRFTFSLANIGGFGNMRRQERLY